MKKFLIFSLLAIVVFSGGCASGYHSINPRTTYFNTTEEINNIEFSYRYNVLKEKGNKKYAKKEDKNKIKVVAVRITNYTGYPLKFSEDIEIHAGNQAVPLLKTAYIHRELRQGVPVYLLYLLFTPMKLYTNVNGNESSANIGYLLGPGLTALNMGRAANANSKFKQELLHYSLQNRVIEDGETVYGLIGIHDLGYAPLKVKLKEYAHY